MSRADPSLVELGRRIREAREAKGLSYQELADLVDLSHHQLRRIEKGESNPHVLAFARIGKELLASLDGLLGDVETVREKTRRLWESHEVALQVAGSRPPDWKAKMAILKAMGLWEE